MIFASLKMLNLKRIESSISSLILGLTLTSFFSVGCNTKQQTPEDPGVLTSAAGLKISCSHSELPLGTASLCKVLYISAEKESDPSQKTYDVTKESKLVGSDDEQISYDSEANGYWVSNSKGDGIFQLRANYQNFVVKENLVMTSSQKGTFHAFSPALEGETDKAASVFLFLEMEDGTLIPIINQFTCEPLDSDVLCDAQNRTITPLTVSDHSVRFTWFNVTIDVSITGIPPKGSTTTTTTSSTTTTTSSTTTTTTIPRGHDGNEDEDSNEDQDDHNVKVCQNVKSASFHHRNHEIPGKIHVTFYEDCNTKHKRPIRRCLVSNAGSGYVEKTNGNSCDIKLKNLGVLMLIIVFENNEKKVMFLTP